MWVVDLIRKILGKECTAEEEREAVEKLFKMIKES